MLKFVKVTGESLSPFFESGDYVLVLGRRWWRRALRPGDVVVFHHPYYGRMIKRVEQACGGELFVVGSHPESTDSRAFGAIPEAWASGRVLWRLARRRPGS